MLAFQFGRHRDVLLRSECLELIARLALILSDALRELLHLGVRRLLRRKTAQLGLAFGVDRRFPHELLLLALVA